MLPVFPREFPRGNSTFISRFVNEVLGAKFGECCRRVMCAQPREEEDRHATGFDTYHGGVCTVCYFTSQCRVQATVYFVAL